VLRHLIVAVTVTLLVVAPVPASAQSKDVSQKASETVGAIKSYTIEKKDEALAYAKKIGADVDTKIKELEAQAARQTGEAKAKSQMLIKDLKAKRAQASQKASELSRATKASWEKAKDAFVDAYREVVAAYERAAAELKK